MDPHLPPTPATLSLIDFVRVYPGETRSTALRRTVTFAQEAERLGYHRVWYAEHHNFPSIASATPAVIVAHVAAHTELIRLGAGGVMLPNHSPYTVAEQFGTLDELHPGRIDLGVGRAPGTDQRTLGRALRRTPGAAESFPDDVVELQRYLAGNTPIPGVRAIPGDQTNVPLYMLGSSLFGARLAARLGLPFAFASHFAPANLHEALRIYCDEFKPSGDNSRPYMIVAHNVLVTEDEAKVTEVMRQHVRSIAGSRLSDAEVNDLLRTPKGQQMAGMLRYFATGNAEAVAAQLEQFRAELGANEIMVVLRAPSWQDQMESMRALSEAWGLKQRG